MGLLRLFYDIVKYRQRFSVRGGPLAEHRTPPADTALSKPSASLEYGRDLGAGSVDVSLVVGCGGACKYSTIDGKMIQFRILSCVCVWYITYYFVIKQDNNTNHWRCTIETTSNVITPRLDWPKRIEWNALDKPTQPYTYGPKTHSIICIEQAHPDVDIMDPFVLNEMHWQSPPGRRHTDPKPIEWNANALTKPTQL